MNCKYCKADCVHSGEDRELDKRSCYIPMTNGDNINGMSNHEKAESIAGLIATEHARVSAGLGHELTATQIGQISYTWFCTLHGWLKQPVEVTDDNT